jgi:hypothetical protein
MRIMLTGGSTLDARILLPLFASVGDVITVATEGVSNKHLRKPKRAPVGPFRSCSAQADRWISL